MRHAQPLYRYRLVYKSLSRIIVVKFDKDGLIDDLNAIEDL